MDLLQMELNENMFEQTELFKETENYMHQAEEPIEEIFSDEFSGLCPRCLDTDFVHNIEKKEDGSYEVLGIMYRDNDKKIIQRCGCKDLNVTY